MIVLEDPPGFVVRTEAQKAAWDNGFRIERGVERGWLQYGSTTAPNTVWIAAGRIAIERQILSVCRVYNGAYKPVRQHFPGAHFAEAREWLAALKMPPVADERLQLLQGSCQRLEALHRVLHVPTDG